MGEVAEDFCLSASTVGTHLYHIKQKLQVNNAAELTPGGAAQRLIEGDARGGGFMGEGLRTARARRTYKSPLASRVLIPVSSAGSLPRAGGIGVDPSPVASGSSSPLIFASSIAGSSGRGRPAL